MYYSYRIKFNRLGPAKYLGHLDMLRYFQKVIMRSGIDVRYSEGFNPHQIISFAYPLGVAMETEGDYVDIDLNSLADCNDITMSLNAVMNEGINVISTVMLPENEPGGMTLVAAADYCITITDDVITDKDIDYIANAKELLVQKEGKKGNIKEVDIKSGVYEIRRIDDNSIFMKLQSGSQMNVKPATIIDLINKLSGKTFKIAAIRRLEIYRDNAGALSPLGQYDL